MAELAATDVDKVDVTDTTDTTDTTAADVSKADTIVTDVDAAKSKTDTTAAVTDDWRARMAGDDPELLKFLGRHGNEAAAIKEFKKLHGEIRSGKYLKQPDDNATDTEKENWRKAMGVPEKPEGYLEKLPDGLVVGDDDKPYVSEFLTAMHEAGAPPAQTNAALAAYYKILEGQSAKEAELLAEAKTTSEDTLREEWGNDYRRNLTAMHSYLDQQPAAVKEAFTNGFGADGKPLGYNAEVLKWLVATALDKNPLATVVPGAGANQASAVADEIAGIEKTMRENRATYNKDKAMQARYLELLEARDRLAARS